MNYLYIILPSVLFLIIFIPIIFFHFRKKSVIKKVQLLSTDEKQSLLDKLAKPVGYHYDSGQDIFTSRRDAPQKVFGYTGLYDLSAPYFNMIFDYETIYFDYNAKTWLIEMWKGQYGINTGCEIGIYYTDKIVFPDQYNTVVFMPVKEKDMPRLSMILNKYPSGKEKYCSIPGRLEGKHWWLTIFKVGLFSKPGELFADISIRFQDYAMMYQFLNNFEKALPDTDYRVNNLTVYFSFKENHRHYSRFQRVIRSIGLFSCRLYCKLFLHLTRDFEKSGDKILYIYYYLPFIIRRLFKPVHKKQKGAMKL